jgi:ferric iron reductase protein FhuF
VTGAADALARLTDVADWLRWRMGAPGEGELACVTLAGSPEDVAHAVATSADVRGTDDPVVLASLWWQGYAYRVGGTALACWLLTGLAPDVRAERMAVGIARGRPSSVVYGSTEATDDAGELSDWLFAGHLDLVAPSLSASRRLGSGLVWGNVAAACAAGAGAVREAAGDRWHDGLATFLAAAPHDLDALGAWEPTPSWAYHRRTCCLWWKTTTSGGALCSDCSLHRADTEGSPRPDDPVS